MASPDTTAALPIYNSAAPRVPIVHELAEIVRYRDLLVQLVSRNVKTRYKRSVLGVAWTLMTPLLMMFVLWAIFSAIFSHTVEHYAVYVLSGILLWTFFSQTTVAIMTELVWGSTLLSRIYVPRTIFALSALGTGLVNVGFALIPLGFFMLVTGTPFTLSLIILPLPILLLAMFSLGVGLVLSTLAVQFTDVVEMYQILITAWMYLTPIIYPLSIIPEESRWLFNLNPLYHFLEVFRAPIQHGRLPEAGHLATATLLAVVMLIVGWWSFVRSADELAYRV